MSDLHGIIYAFHAKPELESLVARRTAASLPFGGRYRLIDFSLSSLMHAGAGGVGVIMQRDYQSLLDHLGSGKDWDMSRHRGGLRLLPPFGLPDSHLGEYKGCMEALAAVRSYVEEIPQSNVALMRGDLCANIDLSAALDRHRGLSADITSVCTNHPSLGTRHRFDLDCDGFAGNIRCNVRAKSSGIAPLEVYIIKKSLLLELIGWCAERGGLHFHRDAISHYFAQGGRMGIYMHEGFALPVTNTADYYTANMSLFDAAVREQLFPNTRPVRTKERQEVSTYYGDMSAVRNCLVADGCFIEGELENCIVFSNVHIGHGARLKNCIIMRNARIGEDCELRYVISDKNVTLSPYTTLSGSERLPIIIPKDSTI